MNYSAGGYIWCVQALQSSLRATTKPAPTPVAPAAVGSFVATIATIEQQG